MRMYTWGQEGNQYAFTTLREVLDSLLFHNCLHEQCAKGIEKRSMDFQAKHRVDLGIE